MGHFICPRVGLRGQYLGIFFQRVLRAILEPTCRSTGASAAIAALPAPAASRSSAVPRCSSAAPVASHALKCGWVAQGAFGGHARGIVRLVSPTEAPRQCPASSFESKGACGKDGIWEGGIMGPSGRGACFFGGVHVGRGHLGVGHLGWGHLGRGSAKG